MDMNHDAAELRSSVPLNGLVEPRVLIRSRSEVGEGPVLDPRTGRLVWVDITRGELIEDDLRTGRQRRVALDTMLGAAVPRATKPGFAVAVSDGFGFVMDGVLTLVAPDFPEPEHRSNDAKCDSRGRLWAGTNHLEFMPGEGKLRVWDGGPSARVVREGFTLPNGIGWSPDDAVMYLVDSFNQHLLLADFHVDAGEVGEFRVLTEFGNGLPDGLAVDREGCIWVAVWGGWEVVRLAPDGSRIGSIRMPVSQPSSCAFGPDGTLYITSATSGLSEEDLEAQPLAGSVFAVPTDALGVPVASFAG
jgi:sugar lactone lactonase YvrE